MDCINHRNKLQTHLRNFAILEFMIWQQAMMKVNRSYWFKLVTCDLEHPIIGSALFQHIIALQRSFVLDFRPNNPGHWFLFLFAFVCWVKLDFLSQARAKGHRIGLNITELRKKNCYTKLEFVYDIQSPWHSSNTSALFVFAASYFKLFSPVASEAVECQQFIPFVPTDTRQFFCCHNMPPASTSSMACSYRSPISSKFLKSFFQWPIPMLFALFSSINFKTINFLDF